MWYLHYLLLIIKGKVMSGALLDIFFLVFIIDKYIRIKKKMKLCERRKLLKNIN